MKVLFKRPFMIALVESCLLSLLGLFCLTAVAQDQLEIKIAMIGIDEKPHLPLSLIDLPIKDPAVPGALMAVKENNQTGTFTGQVFDFTHHLISDDESVDKIAMELLANDVSLFVADLPMEQLLKLADSLKDDGLVFNVRAQDDEIRNQQCRPNLFHLTPSRAMKTDALVQYLVWKRWQEWLVIVGGNAEDQAYLSALQRSAKRFNGKILEIKPWTFDAGSRRTDSGHVLAQQQVPVATRGKDHQILIVADEADEFGEYLIYRTDSPRPVAGTQGLIATSWHRSHEQWGGTQLQRRFFKLSGRDMTPRDYTAWMAVRAIGEATTKINSADHNLIRQFLFSDEFKLAAFKGVALTFRPWNGQLRQPILVVGPRMLVSVSPQDKFLHQFSTLDTLGYDQPESGCQAFNK